MKIRLHLLVCSLVLCVALHAQMKIGNNSTTINSASLLELETTNKGLVFPRVSLTSVSSSSPLAATLLTGTVVFNTNASITNGNGVGLYYWNGSSWVAVTPSISGVAWSLIGNAGTSASTNFIGTTDAIDFIAKTNNIDRIHILGAANGSSKEGWIGMGVSIPRSSLDVTGNYTNKNVFTIQNTSSSGYSSVDMLDNTGSLTGTFGYGNSGTGTFFASRDYFSLYGHDFVLNTNSGNYDFFIKGTNGYIGVNTSTPSERLHVVGNIYLNGAFMPGGAAGTSGYALTSAGAATSPNWTDMSTISWALDGNSLSAVKNLGTTSNFDLPFITNNTEKMRLTAGGLLGIGVTSPQQSLSVSAGVNIDQNNSNTGSIVNALSFGNFSGEGIGSKRSLGGNQYGLDFYTNSNNRMAITLSGLVGVGTTSPSAKLDVAGNFKLGSSGTVLTNMFKTTGTVSAFTASGIGSTTVKTITVTGATTGSSVIVNPQSSLPAGLAIGYSYISSANTLTIGFVSALLSISVSAITFDITVIQ